jgi:hypothetical protein
MCLWTADDLWLCSESLIKCARTETALASGDPSLAVQTAIVSLLNFNELSIFNRGNDGERRNKLKNIFAPPKLIDGVSSVPIALFPLDCGIPSIEERYAHKIIMIPLSEMMIR